MISSIKSQSFSAQIHIQSIQEQHSVTPQKKPSISITNGSGGEDIYERGLKILTASIQFHAETSIDTEELYDKLRSYGSFEELRQNEYTPEKVSDRILGFIKGNFSIYQKQNPKLSEAEAVQKYSEIMQKAVDTGYEKALAVLGEIPEDIASELQKSIDLVHEGLQEFKESFVAIN